jgi:succinyl-diaminopimelate desuccinylase
MPTSKLQEIESYLAENRDCFEAELCELLRIPSVSTDSAHVGDIRAAAEWMKAQFATMGLETEILETDGHPIVWAESPAVDDRPTVLVYGHYDVQPPDPLEEWNSPPFEPQFVGGNVVARGATDDKGQLLTHVKSAQAWQAIAGELPVKLKFLIEGEEEIGSPNLYKFIEEHKEKLACDVAVISDSSQFDRGQPAITYGLKGICYFELTLQGPNQDLHSGTFGGAVSNPANALTRMLAALIDEKGRIQIPGFYDDVQPLSDRERQQYADLPFQESAFKQQVGVDELLGEEGFTTLERRWARPTLDINGLSSGYQGEGAKTVLPAKASAKFSCRLVPNQDPDTIQAQLETMLKSLCPPGIQMDLNYFHGAPGVVVSLESPYMKAAATAIESGFGHSPVFIRAGGSIPVVTAFRDKLGIDTLLLGWGLNDDNTHGPNEKFSIADFHRGIRSSAHLWYELSRLSV